jgi:diketogulonate reductase-like aldo/keto reductase
MQATPLPLDLHIPFPHIGFGTYQLVGSDGARALTAAIDIGYRLIDSAVGYENEGMIGAAIRNAAVPRSDLIVTSKLPGRFHSVSRALTSVEESLWRAGLDQIDLYLIHWPNPRIDRYVSAWEGLLEAKSKGLVAEIGVCNFLPEHLTRLEQETGHMPRVNQVEMHPYFPQAELVEFHNQHDIITQAWSPLGRGNDLLSNEVIIAVAARHGISPAQAVLAWHIARGTVPIPKASALARQQENLLAVHIDLPRKDVVSITALAKPDGRNSGQDPLTYEEM